MIRPIIYQLNRKQSVAIRGRKAYYGLRSHVRTIRRNSPNHMDVAWYAESLGLETEKPVIGKWNQYCGGEWVQTDYPLPNRKVSMTSCTSLAIVGPVGKLP